MFHTAYFLIRLHICMVCASRTALYCNSPTSSKPHGTLVATRLSLSLCKQPRQHLGWVVTNTCTSTDSVQEETHYKGHMGVCRRLWYMYVTACCLSCRQLWYMYVTACCLSCSQLWYMYVAACCLSRRQLWYMYVTACCLSCSP